MTLVTESDTTMQNMRFDMFRFLLILWVVLVSTLGSSNRLFSKFDFEIDEEFQNQIDTRDTQALLPTFSSNPPYIVLGAVFSLTFPDGSINPGGYQSALAMQCAIADMNRIGPELGMATMWFYYILDDKYQTATALRAAIQLFEAGVFITLLPEQSTAAISITALLNAFNITKIGAVVSTDLLSDRFTYGSLFRLSPPDRYSANIIGNIMLHFNWTLVTPIFTDDAYGSSGKAAFSNVATQLGIVSTCERVIPPGELTGIQATIECLSKSESSVVLLWMEATDAFNVVEAFYNSGVLSHITFIATATWGDVRSVELYSRFPISYLQGTLGIIPNPGDQNPFRSCLRQQRVNSSTIPFFNNFLETSLRCKVLNIDEDPSNRLPECSVDFAQRGLYPNLTCACSQDDYLKNIEPLYPVSYVYDATFAIFNAIFQITNNCSELSAAIGTDFCEEREFSTADLNSVLSHIRFEGLTGLVAFNGNDPVSKASILKSLAHNFWLGIEHNILQRRKDGSLATVGFANKAGNITIDDGLLEWKDELPISAIVPHEITFSEPLGFVALIFIVIGLVIALSFSVYFFIYRREKVIKKTSPFFSQLIILGIILCITSQIFWDVYQTTFTCFMKVWLLAVGFGLIMGNLLAKTYRIFKIFNNARVTSLVIRDIDLLKFTGAIFLLEVVLLCLYCFTSGLPRPVVIQSTADSLFRFVQCRVPSDFVQLAGIITLFTVNSILVLGGVTVAFLTRNVDSAFNESLYIAYVVYIYLLASIILLPLYYTTGETASGESRRFVLRTIGILIPMFFTLGALFGPKIYQVYKTKKAEKKLAKVNHDREPGRRVMDFGTSTGGTGVQMTPYDDGYNSNGVGTFTTVLRNNASVSTTTAPNKMRATRGDSSITETIPASSTRPSITTNSEVSNNEYGNLIKSVTKKSD